MSNLLCYFIITSFCLYIMVLQESESTLSCKDASEQFEGNICGLWFDILVWCICSLWLNDTRNQRLSLTGNHSVDLSNSRGLTETDAAH